MGGKEGPFFRYGLCNKVSLLRVRASAGGEGGGVGVVVKEGFADEEDFMKGGGPELLLVQMQQKKVMEKQSKLADKVFNTHTVSLLPWFLFVFIFWKICANKLGEF